MTEAEIGSVEILTDFNKEIFLEKYAVKEIEDDKQITIETEPSQAFRRVAKTLASAFCKNINDYPLSQSDIEELFYKVMVERKGILAGRALLAIGNHASTLTPMNCFVVPIEDSIEGILGSNLLAAAKIQQSGGGFGANFSKIRPKGSPVKGVSSTASGPISFMHTWDSMIATMKSAGNRRGAGIAILDVNHPDILEFITCKKNKDLTNFNISIGITSDFIEALKKDGEIELKHNNKVYRKIKAREIFEKFVENAYDYNEPGIFFKDRVNEYSNSSYYQKIESPNPCLTESTKIATNMGDLSIKEIVDLFAKGEKLSVLSLDIETNNVEYDTVVNALKTKENANVIKIEFDDNTFLELTPDHKVYTENRGFVKASQLTKEDIILGY